MHFFKQHQSLTKVLYKQACEQQTHYYFTHSRRKHKSEAQEATRFAATFKKGK